MNTCPNESCHSPLAAPHEHCTRVLILPGISQNKKSSRRSGFLNPLDFHVHTLTGSQRSGLSRIPRTPHCPDLMTPVTGLSATSDGSLRYQTDPTP